MSELVVPALARDASSFMFWLCWSAPVAGGGGPSGGSASAGPAATSIETRTARGRPTRKIFVTRSSFRTVGPVAIPYARKATTHMFLLLAALGRGRPIGRDVARGTGSARVQRAAGDTL